MHTLTLSPLHSFDSLSFSKMLLEENTLECMHETIADMSLNRKFATYKLLAINLKHPCPTLQYAYIRFQCFRCRAEKFDTQIN